MGLHFSNQLGLFLSRGNTAQLKMKKKRKKIEILLL